MEAVRGRVVVPGELLEDAVVEWDGETLSYVGAPRPGDSEEREAGYILPGLIDLHSHGGGGSSFPDATSLDEVARASAEHRRQGTTVLCATASTMELERMEFVLGLLADGCEQDLIECIEVEGPFLSRERCGAQNPIYLRAPDIEVADRLIDAARGHAWSMAVAPELEGASELVEHLAARGVVPAWAHTNADSTTARRLNEVAVNALRRHGKAATDKPVATHLFNAMRELSHRAPGPVIEYLSAGRRGCAVVELIADGVHLSNDLVRDVVEILGTEPIVLITDSMAAAGMPDGTYELGGLLVHVTNGVARLRGGNLAGGTSRLIDIVRNCVNGGVPLADAVAMASTTPASVLGRTDVGALQAGRRADVVVANEALYVERVYRRGQLVS
ncbi:amidohydrolase family protein [Actinomycetaceae bacterium L2_0104]